MGDPRPLSPAKRVVSVFVLCAAAMLYAGASLAADSSKTDEADAQRRAAEAKAKRNLGFPDVFDYVLRDSDRSTDLYYLSRQIERLSRYLREVSRSLATTVPRNPAAEGAPDDVKAVYGPEGPTARSVSLILEYQLMVAGNPRLRVGQVIDDGGEVKAQVVTGDGSLVDEYRIDKKTGTWTPVR